MNVRDRLKQFVKEHTGLGQKKFEQTVGLSNSFINNMGETIRPENLKKITDKYPELNTAWLLTGKGRMLNDYTEFDAGAAIKEILEMDNVLLDTAADILAAISKRSNKEERKILQGLVNSRLGNEGGAANQNDALNAPSDSSSIPEEVEFDAGAALKKIKEIHHVILSAAAEILATVTNRSVTAERESLQSQVNRRLGLLGSEQ